MLLLVLVATLLPCVAFAEDASLADSLNRGARDLLEAGSYVEAESLATSAIAVGLRLFGESSLPVAESRLLYAHSLRLQGKLGAAEREFRKCLRVRRELLGDDDSSLVEVLRPLGNVLRWQGDPALGLELQLQALAIQRDVPGGEERYASLLNDVAMQHDWLRQHEEAATFHREGLALSETVATRDDFLITKANYALNRAYRLDFSGAMKTLDSLQAESPDNATVREYRAYVADRAGHFALAENLLLECLDHQRATREIPSSSEVFSLIRLARARAGAGDLQGAERYYEQAAETYEEARTHIGSGTKAASFRRTPYENLAAMRLELGKAAGTWTMVERARGRVLGEVLFDDLSEWPFRLERIQASLDERTAIVGWLDSMLRPGMPRFWAYVIRNAGPVDWVPLPHEGYVEMESLAVDVREFRAGLHSAESSAFARRAAKFSQEDAHRVWKNRFAPIEAHLRGVESVVLVPSWAMGGIPVEVFVDDEGRFLGDRYFVSYVPSATIYAWLSEKPAASPSRALIIGDPALRRPEVAEVTHMIASRDIAPGVLRSALRGDSLSLDLLPRLPGTREEVEHIQRLFSEPRSLLGLDASEERIRSLADEEGLDRYDVIHLATHALVDNQDYRSSGLVLSQVNRTTVHDGLLRGDEIEQWDLDADLVTLSACRTALGRNIHGEGVVGFAHPFFAAGSRSLLVSLWKVDDRATSLLMERFYRNWVTAGMSKAEALQDARRRLRDHRTEAGERPFHHPFYWAAFQLIGDPR